MKLSSLLLTCVISSYTSPTYSQLVVLNAAAKQAPIMSTPNIAPPPVDGDNGTPPAGDLIISDVIGKERVINIFAGFTRDLDTISKRLDDVSQNTTVLAPLNSAIQKLPRKPWEDPRDYGALGSNAYGGQDGEERAHKNLRRFVEAHTVPGSPWAEGEEVETLAGNKVWWERKGDNKFIQPGNIEISSIASRVSNGEVWIINGVLNYA